MNGETTEQIKGRMIVRTAIGVPVGANYVTRDKAGTVEFWKNLPIHNNGFWNICDCDEECIDSFETLIPCAHPERTFRRLIAGKVYQRFAENQPNKMYCGTPVEDDD